MGLKIVMSQEPSRHNLIKFGKAGLSKHEIIYITNRDKNVLCQLLGIGKVIEIYREHPDLVITFSYDSYLALLLKILRLKVSYFYGDTIIIDRYRKSNKNYFIDTVRAFFLYAIHNSGQIISCLVSDSVFCLEKNQEKKALRFNKNVFYWKAKVDTDMFSNRGPKLDLAESDLFSVLISNFSIDVFEGVDKIIPLIEKCTNIQFYITGNIRNREILDKLKNFKNVIYLGRIDFCDMPRLYRSVDITLDLFESRKVMGSYTINESLSCGTPIVGFDHGALALKHNYNSLLSETIEGISEHLIYLSKHPEEVKKLSSNAKKSILKYSVNTQAPKLTADKLLGKKNKAMKKSRIEGKT
jgi:glycosyltransferase involved in cell wall biosynthesis